MSKHFVVAALVIVCSAPLRAASPQEPRPAAKPAATPAFSAPTPSGWKAKAPAPDRFRDLDFQVGADDKTSCYLTASVGGGAEANLKRWYGQMGVAPPADFKGLPKAELLGREGSLAEIAGDYRGLPGYLMLAILTSEGDQCTTLKLVGPKEVVAAERERFLQLAKDIRRGGDAADKPTKKADDKTKGDGKTDGKGDGKTDGKTDGKSEGKAEGKGGASTGKGPFATAKVPAGWTEVPTTSSMRLCTFKIGAESELAVFKMAGAGGGMRANLDRWRGQVGQQPMTDAEFAALPKIAVLGSEAPMVESRGKFLDGMTGRSFDDAVLLGVALEEKDAAFFFKLTGPAAEVTAHKQEFLDYCASLRH